MPVYYLKVLKNLVDDNYLDFRHLYFSLRGITKTAKEFLCDHLFRQGGLFACPKASLSTISDDSA